MGNDGLQTGEDQDCEHAYLSLIRPDLLLSGWAFGPQNFMKMIQSFAQSKGPERRG